MTVRCSLHMNKDLQEKRPAIAVCHHCGKPLCALIDLNEPIAFTQGTKPIFCGYTIKDPYFYRDQWLFKQPEKAHHCEACLIANHRNFRVRLMGLKQRYD